MTTGTEEVVVEQQEQTVEQAEAELAAGFNRVRPEETEKQAGPVTMLTEEETPSTEAAPAVEATPAEADPLDARFAAYDAKNNERLRKLEGHIGGLKSQLQQALNTAKDVKAGGKDAPTGDQITAAPIGSAKWAKLKEEFPEWGEAIEEVLATRTPAPKADTTDIRRELATEIQTRTTEARDEARQLARLDIKHEGWEQTVVSPEFETWGFANGPNEAERSQFKELTRTAPDKAAALQHDFAKKYPQWWAERGALMDSTNASDAIKLLDAFKEHQATAAQAAAVKQGKTNRLAGAAPLKGAAVGAPRLLNDEDGLTVGFNKVRGQKAA